MSSAEIEKNLRARKKNLQNSSRFSSFATPHCAADLKRQHDTAFAQVIFSRTLRAWCGDTHECVCDTARPRLLTVRRRTQQHSAGKIPKWSRPRKGGVPVSASANPLQVDYRYVVPASGRARRFAQSVSYSTKARVPVGSTRLRENRTKRPTGCEDSSLPGVAWPGWQLVGKSHQLSGARCLASQS